MRGTPGTPRYKIREAFKAVGMPYEHNEPRDMPGCSLVFSLSLVHLPLFYIPFPSIKSPALPSSRFPPRIRPPLIHPFATNTLIAVAWWFVRPININTEKLLLGHVTQDDENGDPIERGYDVVNWWTKPKKA